MSTYSVDLKSRAILVDFDGGFFNWTRRDARVEKDVASQNGVRNDAGRYLKNLFLGCDQPLAEIRTIVHKARQTHELHTLPWEENRRLLLTTNYLRYMEAFNRHRCDLDVAKAQLSDAFDNLITQSRYFLGPLWRQDDYPSKAHVLSACYVSLKHYAVSDASDVRLEVDDETVASIQAEISKNQSDQFEEAVSSAWEKLYKVMNTAVRNLSKGSNPSERFHVGWFDDLAELLPALQGLNLTNDPRLDTLAKRCSSLITGVNPDDYKVSKDTRATAATVAQSIFDDLSAIYTPPAKEVA